MSELRIPSTTSRVWEKTEWGARSNAMSTIAEGILAVKLFSYISECDHLTKMLICLF